MDKEQVYQHVVSMVTSSTKTPKYMSVSTVKMADLFGSESAIIEQNLNELVKDGRLVKSTLPEMSNYEVYMLPNS